MPEEKALILVVEDDVDVAEMLSTYFGAQGYRVVEAYEGREAVRLCGLRHPDLVILDIRLPDIDGFQVAEQLRSNQRTSDIPIVFLTEKRDRADRLQGLGIGADDYITKPFDIHELHLRVRNVIRRSAQASLSNPVTGLSEGVLVDEYLSDCLQSKNWSLLMVYIENLSSFRDSYGFVAADDTQRAVSLVIQSAVKAAGNPAAFIGQLGADRFVVLTMPDTQQAIVDHVRSRLGQSMDYFYPMEDRNKWAQLPNRLGIKLARLSASDVRLADLDSLKAELNRRLE